MATIDKLILVFLTAACAFWAFAAWHYDTAQAGVMFATSLIMIAIIGRRAKAGRS